jgi:acylphosphatase
MFVLDRASRLGLHGYVRNMADGSVEVVARGGEREMGQLEAALRVGPEGAKVARVDGGEAGGVEFPEPFEVRV